jgi:alkanesulfonate monooxygenase SsuD/methylene tetrahydromethanopterin reductase-like flavin-dependent oxidoreductase (luciferase family)
VAEGTRAGLFLATRDDPDLVREAASLGFESVWAGEGQGKSAFGKLERWAAATDEIGLATGIVNVYSRSPAAVAQSIATLDAHSGGRAILGLGVAHPGVVADFHGMTFDRPLPRMAEYIELVRRYLRGDPAGFDGAFFSPARTAFWDAFEPERAEIPIYNAALGPANVRLTGEYADGWLPNFYPESRFESALSWLETGLARADRDRSDVDVAMYVLAAVHDDEARARRAAASHIAYYCREIPGYYAGVAEAAGFGDEVAAVRAAETDEAAADAVTADLVDALALAGTEADVREGLAGLRAAGVGLPIVRAPAGTSDAWLERAMAAAAPVREHT